MCSGESERQWMALFPRTGCMNQQSHPSQSQWFKNQTEVDNIHNSGSKTSVKTTNFNWIVDFLCRSEWAKQEYGTASFFCYFLVVTFFVPFFVVTRTHKKIEILFRPFIRIIVVFVASFPANAFCFMLQFNVMLLSGHMQPLFFAKTTTALAPQNGMHPSQMNLATTINYFHSNSLNDHQLFQYKKLNLFA